MKESERRRESREGEEKMITELAMLAFTLSWLPNVFCFQMQHASTVLSSKVS